MSIAVHHIVLETAVTDGVYVDSTYHNVSFREKLKLLFSYKFWFQSADFI